jgi:hypothetical protein
MLRKQRTRAQLIEDLGFNCIEYEIIHAGFTMRRSTPNHDYGFDGYIQFFYPNGEFHPNGAKFQLKSTDNIKYSSVENAFACDLSVKDLVTWLETTENTLLILFDAQNEVAYFTDLQDYFRQNPEVLRNVKKYIRVYLPVQKVFNVQAVQSLPKI